MAKYMGAALLLLVGLLTLLIILVDGCNDNLNDFAQKTDSVKTTYIGNEVIIKDDTLLIINASSFGTEYTLEDNRIISEKLLETLTLLKK